MRIKNWKKFQHYQHRKPPWIRFYRDLLDDREWMALSGDASKMLANCWLLASEDNGELPSVEDIAWRLRMQLKQVKSLISELNHWLEPDASTMLAECKQDATTDTDTDTDKISDPKGSHVNGRSVDPLDASFSKGIENYNKAAEVLGLPKAENVSPRRKTKLKARLREHGLHGWNRALQNIAEMPFCCGENDRGWRVSLDWLLEPSNLNKVLEMAYARPEKELH